MYRPLLSDVDRHTQVSQSETHTYSHARFVRNTIKWHNLNAEHDAIDTGCIGNYDYKIYVKYTSRVTFSAHARFARRRDDIFNRVISTETGH